MKIKVMYLGSISLSGVCHITEVESPSMAYDRVYTPLCRSNGKGMVLLDPIEEDVLEELDWVLCPDCEEIK